MKLEQLEQKYAELGAEIERLKNKTKPWPQERNVAYMLWDNGLVTKGVYTTKDFRNCVENGSVFRTEDEALAERDYRQAYRKVTERIRELNDGWVPDWTPSSPKNFYFYKNFYEDTVGISLSASTATIRAALIMKSSEIAETVLSEMKHDVIAVLRG